MKIQEGIWEDLKEGKGSEKCNIIISKVKKSQRNKYWIYILI